jgi:hypothetical protein
MTLGEQHTFTDENMDAPTLKKHGYDTHMPPIRLVCSCGWKSDFISQGQGEWNARKTVRILHLLESMPVA